MSKTKYSSILQNTTIYLELLRKHYIHTYYNYNDRVEMKKEKKQ